MKLTVFERAVLANQLHILEILDPKEQQYYAYARRGIEEGYESMFDDALRAIDKPVSEERCNRVLSVLNMYRALTFSYESLEDKSGLTSKDVAFPGFDGNEETESFAFARYFCEDPPTGRFTELGRPDNFNSHWPKWPQYDAMLEEWAKVGNKNDLSADEIRRILKAER